MKIRSLGYIGIEGPNPKDWLPFATEVCGLTPAILVPGDDPAGSPSADGTSKDGTVYLKMDERQWRLAVHPGEQPGLRYMGFELGSSSDLDLAVAEVS
jgi:3,4-dihydroxy-9,10-secoandrosta-1,3,5(10)-triene-9,17-dione 4,5-dioxygenase